VKELSTVNSRDCMDRVLWDKALRALGHPPS
jgi:hypothetical protein